MRILITGANGQLGNEMRIVASSSSDYYIFTDISSSNNTDYLDITDISAVRKFVAEKKVDVIVNCAAWTNVDAAESNIDLAERLNAKAPENLAIAIKEVGGLLIHISTDYVFGQEPYNVPCRENQKGTPTGVYGLTKLHGELKIQTIGCDHVIIRTAWLYSEFGKNFCKTMLSLTSSKPQVNVVFDQAGTPTYALDLAEAIKVILEDYKSEFSNIKPEFTESAKSELAKSELTELESTESESTENVNSEANIKNKKVTKYSKSGIYHYSNEGVCSWFDFAKMIAEYADNISCDIRPCHSSEFPSPVVRPSYSVLDKTKIKETFGIKIPYWTDSLKKCINNLKKA